MIALVAVLQAAAPEVTAMVDRTRLPVGDEVLLTVRARTSSGEPLSLALPALSGLVIVGSRELTEVRVAQAGGPVRLTLREVRLRAERPGRGVIGPVRARQGDAVAATEAITLLVDSAPGGVGAALSPPARALLDAAPAPAIADRVSLTVVVPNDTVRVGEQVDVVAVAWFPRGLRGRLRGQPVIQLPTPEGAWAHLQRPLGGVVASRRLGPEWMDLYATHQILFPLTAGPLALPPATVDYTLATGHSYFSREERFSLASDTARLTVLATPRAGRPADDRGVVARDLRLVVTLDSADRRVGEPLAVTAALSGTGNAALWPEPPVRWPAGLRAYPGETTVRYASDEGRVGGTKTFGFFVVPDSAGTLVVPPVRYPYYDVGRGAHRAASTPSQTLIVAPGREPPTARTAPPLLAPRPAPLEPPAWAWALVAAGPPGLFWLVQRRRRPRPITRPSAAVPEPELRRAERAFLAVLASHVPDAAARESAGLAPALRAAGIEGAVAQHVVRLRDRLRAARYGPRGAGDPAELAAEVRQVLKALGADRRGRRRTAVGLVWLVVAGAGGVSAAQAPTAETLYQAGALRAAADSFAARATDAPGVTAHWYNLGAAHYRAGADGEAIAAWTRAARLEPRNRTIARARRLLPPPDAASEPLLAVGVATPVEWGLAAAAGWLLAWLAVLMRWRPSTRLVPGGVALVLAVQAGLAWVRGSRPLAVVVADATPVRVAPYGSATPAATLDGGAAVLVARTRGSWLEVRRDDGVWGWILAAEVARP